MPDTVHPPLSVIESWPKPNYVNPDNRGPGLIYLCVILSVLGVITVAARLYSRLFITKAPGIDDALIVVSIGFAIALASLIVVDNIHHGSGYHNWDIRPETMPDHRLKVWTSQWCYIVATTSVKVSILLFYRRLSVKFSRSFFIATWIGIVYNVCYMFAFFLVLLLQCQPVEAYWMSTYAKWADSHKFHCTGESVILPMSAGLSVIGDFYSATLPIILISGLQMPKGQKRSLYALFATAFLVVGAGVARTIVLNRVINLDYDSLWVLWDNWIWTMIELFVAIVAASAPALKPFFRRFLGPPNSGLGYHSWRRDRNSTPAPPKGHSLQHLKFKNWSFGSSRRPRGYPRDIETIGIAHGGTDFTKSREESFVREVDNPDLETRHYELRTSRDGKIIPTQVWKRSDASSLSGRENNHHHEDRGYGLKHTASWPTMPSPARQSDDSEVRSGRPRGHTKNFSHPQIPLYHELPKPKKSRASVTASKILGRPHSKKTRTSSGPDQPRPDFYSATTVDPQTPVATRLDSPSDSEGEKYRSEKFPRNTVYSTTTTMNGRSRAGSEETLHLPRMGTPEYYFKQR